MHGASSARRMDPSQPVPADAWQLAGRDPYVAIPLLITFVFVGYVLVRGVVPILRDMLAEMKATREMATKAVEQLEGKVDGAVGQITSIRASIDRVETEMGGMKTEMGSLTARLIHVELELDAKKPPRRRQPE